MMLMYIIITIIMRYTSSKSGLVVVVDLQNLLDVLSNPPT